MEKFYSFVIPAYNEEINIPILYDKLIDLMAETSGKWELIFINDGSTDNTLEVLKNFAAKDERVKFLSFTRNFGHQPALTAGFAYAKGDAIISLDCDLQDPPDVIKEMIVKWLDGYDVVYARRKNFRKDNIMKRYASKAYYSLLDKFSDVSIPRNVGDFRLVDRRVLDLINSMPEKSRYLRGMVAWAGYKYGFVDYHRPDREYGESGYTFKKLVQLGMSGFLNFSFLPLQVALWLGAISMLLGGGFIFYMLFDIIINDVYYELFKWLVVLLFVFIGFVFILLWIIGEYIGRILNQVRERPVYIVNEKVNI